MLQLQLEKVSVSYADRTVLRNVSTTFRGGRMTAVIGKNGAGKSTLMKAVAGRSAVKKSGRVRLFDDANGAEYSANDIAYLPQISSAHSRLTVFEMVLLGLVKELRWRVGDEQLAAVERVLEELQLTKLSGRPFNDLSGGQKQLVSMAQSLVSKPKVLLLDEPTSALDLRHQLIVMDLARTYVRTTGAIGIFVVHDLMLASRYGDWMMLLDEADIRLHDKPENVLLPDVLERVYQVEVNVEQNALGYVNVVPVKPL